MCKCVLSYDVDDIRDAFAKSNVSFLVSSNELNNGVDQRLKSSARFSVEFRIDIIKKERRLGDARFHTHKLHVFCT